MFVKCLGSGDAFGSGGRLNTSFYVRTTSQEILLDCGASTLAALKKDGMSAHQIDTILITHLHGDHFGGLPFILCEIKAIKARKKPLTIVGPPGLREKSLMALHSFYPGVEVDDSLVSFVTYEARVPLTLGDCIVTPYRVIHSPESNPHCLRIEHRGKVVTYSGDTEWTDELLPASAGADLFICEGTTYETVVPQHLAIKDLLDQLPRIRSKRIVVTHLAEEALRAASSIPLEIAADGAILMDD